MGGHKGVEKTPDLRQAVLTTPVLKVVGGGSSWIRTQARVAFSWLLRTRKKRVRNSHGLCFGIYVNVPVRVNKYVVYFWRMDSFVLTRSKKKKTHGSSLLQFAILYEKRGTLDTKYSHIYFCILEICFALLSFTIIPPDSIIGPALGHSWQCFCYWLVVIRICGTPGWLYAEPNTTGNWHVRLSSLEKKIRFKGRMIILPTKQKIKRNSIKEKSI